MELKSNLQFLIVQIQFETVVNEPRFTLREQTDLNMLTDLEMGLLMRGVNEFTSFDLRFQRKIWSISEAHGNGSYWTHRTVRGSPK